MAEPPVPPATAVLVTGGSRGLGLAVVQDLLDRGTRVAAFARTVSDSLRDLANAHPGTLLAGAVDARDTVATLAFLRAAEEALGPLDGLVNNAGVAQDSVLAHTAPADIERVLSTNLLAPLLLTRAFLRQVLRRAGTARVVTIGSACAQATYPGMVAYAASKAGLEAATRALSAETHGRVLVNCVAPGFFDSDMSSLYSERHRAAIARRTATGTLMHPGHVVPMVRMLLLDDTGINGQILPVNGGGVR
ncbi:SDR family NAD(P)-dependent oxidoreductase [Streptomyces niveiscabiei]|uniref:SDR family NAD(P)-dependent oxidoreductase n=1 Tax=Streptomyces niveiscabiei TaxID=164115 RepID=A0ABW9I5T7_9ACTN